MEAELIASGVEELVAGVVEPARGVEGTVTEAVVTDAETDTDEEDEGMEPSWMSGDHLADP